MMAKAHLRNKEGIIKHINKYMFLKFFYFINRNIPFKPNFGNKKKK